MILDKLQTYPALRQQITVWFSAGVVDGERYLPSDTGIAQGGVLSPLLMNIALHGMEDVVTAGTANRQSREQPLLVRYADNFLLLHSDLHELQRVVKRVEPWLARMGFHLHPDKTRISHTLIPYQGAVGFDFLGFALHQEADEALFRWHQRGRASRVAPVQTYPSKVKTIISPSQEASKRHLEAMDQRLQRVQNATQALVIAELNPLIIGWATYYTGIVSAEIMSRYDDLLTQRLLQWARSRHPGKTQDWLFAHYWHQEKRNGKIFATPDGKQLRRYQHMSILDGSNL